MCDQIFLSPVAHVAEPLLDKHGWDLLPILPVSQMFHLWSGVTVTCTQVLYSPIGHVVEPLVDERWRDLLLEVPHAGELLRDHHQHADVARVGKQQDVALHVVVAGRLVAALVLHHGHTHLLFLIHAEVTVVRLLLGELHFPCAWGADKREG